MLKSVSQMAEHVVLKLLCEAMEPNNCVSQHDVLDWDIA
jgi:hypothetical protein